MLLARFRPWLLVASTLTSGLARADDPARVGLHEGGRGAIVPTRQVLRPAGQALEYPGRPVDLALAPGGGILYAKDNRGLVAIDAEAWRVVQILPFPKGGGSMHGLAVSADGSRVFATDAENGLHEAEVADDGTLSWARRIALPGPGGKGPSYGCGLALDPDGATALVCLSRNNTLGVVDLAEGRLVREIPVGVAPFDVILGEPGRVAFVSNWGGRRPREGKLTAPSSGTPVEVDDRGVGSSGTVGKVDLAEGRMVAEIDVGLHPSDLALAPDGRRLFVANGNSDTVSILDATAFRVDETIPVRPHPDLPFGSAPNALALSTDGRTLYVANGGNNAVAVVAPSGSADTPSRVLGFIPTAWYPGALALDGPTLYVANVKGLGSRGEPRDDGGRSVGSFLGVISRVERPDEGALRAMTAQVEEDARIPQILRAQEKAERAADAPPVPVPARPGEPSVFDHVVYVIKENRTYDQLLGDLPRGDGDPSLCLYGRDVTPNHHALAEQFAILDNFYCNGVLSADGHAWATEGNVTDYLEKAFGGFTRSYTFGDDPLSYSSSGFLWDKVLRRGLSFRNYGEMDYAEPVPGDATFAQIYEDYRSGRRQIRFTQKIGIETLRRYTCPTYPGWNMKIPDVLRVDAFLAELKQFEEEGDLPNLIILYLPQDHTSGTSPGMPTPRAHMADNDLALGRAVEAISRSRFWPRTCIFVTEDDPQDGFDHVDGHRSICLVVSPYTKRGEVVSDFYNQTSVLHTMERILGCSPLNQMDAMAPLMTTCFRDEPDLAPYEALTPSVPLDELNEPTSRLDGPALEWARRSQALDLRHPDRADEDLLNRILWHAAKGVEARYPQHLAGAHGRGLEARGLVLQPSREEDDEGAED